MKNNKLFIVGSGGFGREVLMTIERSYEHKWDSIMLVDDNIKNDQNDYEYFGPISKLFAYNLNADIVIAISDVNTRCKIYQKLKRKNYFSFPNIIDKSSVLDIKTIEIGKGNLIMLNCIISTDVNLGDFNLLNSYSGIGHDCKIGSFNTFNPRCAISGNVGIENLNSFGMNSAIVQNKNIGSNNSIWPGSIIFKNIKSNCVYYGNPAKKILV